MKTSDGTVLLIVAGALCTQAALAQTEETPKGEIGGRTLKKINADGTVDCYPPCSAAGICC